jgi:putative ABC transport system permease protein
MGLGVMVNGLAGLMIGEALVGTRGMGRQLTAPFVGAVAYYLAISLLLAAGMPPPDLKLITGLFVLAMLAAPSLRDRKRR